MLWTAGASGGVLEVGLTVDKADAADDFAEPAALCAQAELEDHGQCRSA
jgi:hypothetical protein